MSLFIAGYSIIIIYFHSAGFRLIFLSFYGDGGVLSSADDLHALLGFAVLSGHDGIELFHRILHAVIDHEIVIGMGGLEFHLGTQQPLLNLF